MIRYLAITAASLVVAIAASIWSGGLIVAGTWPGPSPYGGAYRATLAVQMTMPPEAGLLLSCDDFRTFGRPGVLWVWNDEIVGEWGGPR